MTRLVSSRTVFVVLLGVAVAVSACSANQAGPDDSTGPGSSSNATSSPISARVLPVPVPVAGTSLTGSESFVGTAERVPVVAVPEGSSRAPLPAPGQPGYLSVERIAFRRFGSGKDLLLVMGQDGTMAWWEPSLLSMLAGHYTVTIFDLPGIGYSEAATVPVTLPWLADETAGLIQALGLVHPTVVGWGLGGDVALSLAERHPASLGSLVLVDTSAGGPTARPPAPSVSALFDSQWASASSLASTIFQSDATSVSGSPTPASEAAAWLTAVRSDVPDDVTQEGLAEERAVQLGVWSSGLLSEATDLVTVPSLVAFGTDDAVFPAPDGALLAGSISGAQTVALAGAGYGAMFEDSSQVVAALERFSG